VTEPAPGTAGERVRFATIAVVGSGLAGHSDALTYGVPEADRGQIVPGSIVWAPLRDRVVTGVVTEVSADDPGFTVRPLISVLAGIRLSDSQLAVARWVAHQTASPLGLTASLFFPPQLASRAAEMLSVNPDRPDDALLTRTQVETLAALESMGEATPDALKKRLNRPLTTVLPALISAGAITRRISLPEPPRRRSVVHQVRLSDEQPERATGERQQELLRYLSLRGRTSADGWLDEKAVLAATGASRDTLKRLVQNGWAEQRTIDSAGTPPERDLPPALTEEQQRVWRVMEAQLGSGDPTPLLLRGVTGSGKTELYLRAIAWCLRRGKRAIVLAPEIALASQLVRRVAARFPVETAILHSGLKPGERLKTWHEIAGGERRVVVGPRSALFAPLDDIGLIVLDEEHEPAYKQDQEPRYHARAVAECLAREHGALLVLGSATPSIESVWRARYGEIREVRLNTRVNPVTGESGDALELPQVDIVDLRLELHRGHTSLLSQPLIAAVSDALASGEQALLFLNRRGSATVILCGDCGNTLRCPYCDIPHVFHEDRKLLICHRCGFQAIPPPRCPRCSGHLQFLGAGTQRVAQVAKLTFPHARVARWDQDSVRKQGAQDRLLHQIERREHDIIVGTQMIAKGLDLPHVTVVGVIQADSLLQLPDFRSAERAFQLITQVAGRAGRRRSGGRVIVQTYNPAHYAIRAAADHDVDAFVAEEIEFRRRQRYPPFSRLIRYVVRRATDEQCAEEADNLVRMLARHARARNADIDLLGPVPAFAYRIGGQYQWQLVVRAAPDDLERLLDDLPAPRGWVVDVDPQSVL
jgi:primosomal protein N' (replication factor Y)